MIFRFAILSAVSTYQQTKGTSLEDQIAICRRMSERGWNETAGPYIVSGQNRTQYLNLRDAEIEIPAVRDLLEGARKREYDVLVVYDHDRLRDLLSLVYASLSDYGVQLYSVTAQNTPVPPDQYDPYENDTNELMIGISAIRSKAEISRMRRKYRQGMRNRILVHGLPVQIPYGYKRPPTETATRKVIPEPVPSLTAHIVAIKDLYLRGKSLGECVEYLEANQLPPPRGSVWHHQTVRDILKNPFYAGFVQFEKSKVKKDRRQNRKSRDRHIPPERIVTNRGKHQPLWDETTHRAIVEEMRRRARNFRGRMNNQFTGLLRCGECGASLWRFKNGPRGVPDRLIWRCAEDRKDHPHRTHVELVERIGSLLAQSLAPHLEARQTSIPSIPAPPKHDLLADLRAQRARLEDAYQRGLFSVESFSARTAVLDEKIHAEENRAAHEEVEAERRRLTRQMLTASLGKHAARLPDWLARADPGEVNRILHLLLEKIVVYADRIELVYAE